MHRTGGFGHSHEPREGKRPHRSASPWDAQPFGDHFPYATYEDFVRRVKFMSKLKLNLTNVPQDGQYTFQAGDRMVNVRVASIPRFGETYTLRLLDPKRGIEALTELGFQRDP